MAALSPGLYALVFESGGTPSTILYVTSTDGGETWSTPQDLVNDGDDDVGPLIYFSALTGLDIAYHDRTKGEVVSVKITSSSNTRAGRASISISMPVEITSGLPESISVDSAGNIYVGVFGGAGNPSGVSYWKSTDGGNMWSQLTNAPINLDLTTDANVAAGASGVAFVWTDNNFMTSSINRLASFSPDGGQTYTIPTVLHSYTNGAAGIYFNPTLSFSGGVFIDFATVFPGGGAATTALYDSFTINSGAIVPAPDEPIGGSGLSGAFGVVINSNVVGIAVDTSNNNTLDVGIGPLGAPMSLAPVSPAVTGVQEARIFSLGNQLAIPIVQTSEPGPLSVITGSFSSP